MSEERFAKIDNELRSHGEDLAVFKVVVGELKTHMHKVEDKLDKIHSAYLEMQGTMKAILDLRTEIKETKDEMAKHKAEVEKDLKETQEETRKLEKNFIKAGAVVGTLLFLANFFHDEILGLFR